MTLLDGEYRERDIAVGVPCVLDAHGIEAVITLDLDEAEHADFKRSTVAVREDIERLKRLT